MDLDGDGYRDIITGSWPGELYIFRGGPNGTFSAPEMLKDKDGDIINAGGGVHENPDGSIMIVGDAKFENTAEGDFVVYQGKRIKSTPEKQIMVTGSASVVHAADWFGTGKLDLLVGDIQGRVYVLANEGTSKKYAFAKPRQLKAGDKPIRVEGDAGPFVADWDGDGLLDLLVGSGDGSVWFYRNIGTAKAPKLAAGVRILSPGKISYDSGAPKNPRRGVRSKICAVDWNGDGRLDLLVGDIATQKPNLPEPTAEQKAEHKKLRSELVSVQLKYSKLVNKMFGPSRAKTEEEQKKVQEEWEPLRKRMQELQAKLPPEYETHGWVWLFLRKPAPAKVAEK